MPTLLLIDPMEHALRRGQHSLETPTKTHGGPSGLCQAEADDSGVGPHSAMVGPAPLDVGPPGQLCWGWGCVLGARWLGQGTSSRRKETGAARPRALCRAPQAARILVFATLHAGCVCIRNARTGKPQRESR